MKAFTKLVFSLFILLVVVLLLYALVLKNPPTKLPTYVIVGDEKDIPEKACEEIGSRVLVIEETGCPACAKAIPILQSIEKKFNFKFKYFDILDENQRAELMKLGFVPTGVPAVVIDCKVHLGALTEQKYLDLLKETHIQSY